MLQNKQRRKNLSQTEPKQFGEIKLGRALGLGSGIALVIGSIIGMGIYSMLAPIAANSGNAMWLAFCIAIIISAVGVVPIIQGASAVPRAGVGYVLVSRLSNPLIGSLISLLAVIGGASAAAVVSIGFAGNIAAYWTWGIDKAVEIRIISLCIPVVFMGLYLFKLQLANWAQIIMVVLKVFALGVFIIAGIFIVNHPIQLSFVGPKGAGGLVFAVILCYTTCMGFQIIAEMGEEITHPKRNIPLSMLIGGLIVLIIYILVGAVFLGSTTYNFDAMMKMKSPVIDSARTFLPEGWVAFIGLGALFAAFTSINASAMALPREILAQARDNLLPSGIGKVNARTLTPIRAIGIFFILLFLFLCLQFANVDMDFYGVLAAVGILVMTIVAGFVVIRLPDKFPEEYKKAYVRLSKSWLIVFAILTAVTSLPFIVLVLMDYKNSLLILGVLIGLIVLFTIYYVLRVRWLKKHGDKWEERTKVITGSSE
jgi:APA family basic amino acid/polyamine antiporter